MKKLIFILLATFSIQAFGQSFNEDKTAFTNYIKRMYKFKAFEGVKIVEDYNDAYLISALSLPADKYSSESMMMRVADVKAQSQASTFLNGSNITMDMVMTTEEKEDADGAKESTTTMIESIKQNADGFVKAMELLTSFEIDDGERVLFIYMKKMQQAIAPAEDM